MKNITLKIDDDTYRSARIFAAKRDSSVSALVREFLNSLAESENSESPNTGNRGNVALEKLWEMAEQRNQPGPAAMSSRSEFYDEQLR